MPLYEYECLKCARRTERIERVSGPHLKKCPHCGGKVERVLAPPAIQFKGSGWYVTDYAAKSDGTAGQESAKETSSDGAGGGEAKAKEPPAKEGKKAEKKK